jgi:hypothetical protein
MTDAITVPESSAVGPHADFECRTCEVTYSDLPAKSVRCPVCEKKRGFRRLFNRVQVSTTGHRVARILDPMMKPQLEQMDRINGEAKASHARLIADVDRQVELAPAAMKPALKQMQAHGPVQWHGRDAAKGMLAGVAPEWRAASNANLPHLKRRILKLPA